MCKPGGRILLLQHGKGSWRFINNVLDNGAGGCCRLGCRREGAWWLAVGGGKPQCLGARRAVSAASACNLPAAGAHFLKWGCWWNRDIEQIVRQAGLEIDSMSRWHFGTTYLVVARPPAEALLQ